MIEFSLDSAIISAVISASIAIVIILYKEHKLEPEKWKKTAGFEDLNKKLRAYGSLIIFLEAAKKRGLQSNNPYLTTIPAGVSKFQDIFDKNYHLFSAELIEAYLAVVEIDKQFRLISESPKNESVRFSYFSMDLTKMHEIANREFEDLKKKYDEEIKPS